MTVFMVLSSWQSHCESSPGSFDECRTAPSGRRPNTKPHDLGSDCESACIGCQSLHPPSPFILITQPESWYSFYRPTEGRRLSRRSWLVTYWDGLPVHIPGTNRVWRSAITLIEANALRLTTKTKCRRLQALVVPQNRLPFWTISLALEPADCVLYFKTKMAVLDEWIVIQCQCLWTCFVYLRKWFFPASWPVP